MMSEQPPSSGRPTRSERAESLLNALSGVQVPNGLEAAISAAVSRRPAARAIPVRGGRVLALVAAITVLAVGGVLLSGGAPRIQIPSGSLTPAGSAVAAATASPHGETAAPPAIPSPTRGVASSPEATASPRPPVVEGLARLIDPIVLLSTPASGSDGIEVPAGSVIYVLAGTISNTGGTWRMAQWSGDFVNAWRPEGYSGWILDDGLATRSADYEPPCPTAPTVVQLAEMTDGQRLVCYESAELRLSPVAPVEIRVGGPTDVWLSSRQSGEPENSLPAFVPAGSGNVLPLYQWVTATGRFDSPGALGCVPSAPEGEPDVTFLRCRERFVVLRTDAAESPASVVRGTWRAIAQPPINGSLGSSSAWTGSEILIWTWGRDPQAAAYDPVADRWRVLPDAGLSARAVPAAAWTGTHWFIWGGHSAQGAARTDGAIYDLERDRWTALGRAPIGGGLSSAVWTGDRILVLTTHGEFAAYAPTTATWTRLPDAPASKGWRQLFLIDQHVVAFTWGEGLLEPVRLASFDPVTGAWSSLTETPLSALNSSSGVALGEKVYLVRDVYNQADQGGRWSNGVYDDRTGDWQPFQQTCTGYPQSVVATELGLLSEDWLLDPVTGTCRALPRQPDRPDTGQNIREFPAAVWTGTELIIWSGGTGGDGGPTPNDGVAFRPDL